MNTWTAAHGPARGTAWSILDEKENPRPAYQTAPTPYAVAEDTSGNYATSSLSVTVSNTGPVISAVSSGTPGSTSATITWTTNEAATSVINYGTTSGYGSASSSAALITSHTITLTGLATSTTYHFQVQSVDGLGFTATSSDQTFTTSSSTATFATLDPSNTSADLTLFNGNLTATANTTNPNGNVSRSTTSHSSGKYYFEATASDPGGVYQDAVGILYASEAVSNNYLGASKNSIGYFENGQLWLSGGHGYYAATYGDGDIVDFSVDLTNEKMWVRVNGGNWNNDGTANPSTNTGGFGISVIALPVFAGVEADTSGKAWTVNFGSTAYAYTPPAGFGNW